MSRAVCPGSFDPVTNGHVDIIGRAAALFDEVVVAVGVNPSKNRLFGDDERLAMIERACAGLPTCASRLRGPADDFCAERGIAAVVKGLRGGADFDYELPMAQMNPSLTGVETVFVPSRPDRRSSPPAWSRRSRRFGGDVAPFVPDFVLGPLRDRVAERAAGGA